MPGTFWHVEGNSLVIQRDPGFNPGYKNQRNAPGHICKPGRAGDLWRIPAEHGQIYGFFNELEYGLQKIGYSIKIYRLPFQFEMIIHGRCIAGYYC